jgi:hypothetical protein
MTATPSAADVLRLAAAVRRRTLLVCAVERALLGLAVGCLAALPVLAAGWVWPELPRVPIAAALAIAAGVIGAALGVVGAPGTIAAAARLDRRAGLRSGFAAAVELAGSPAPGEFAGPLFADALRRYERTGAARTPLGERGSLPGRLCAPAVAAVVLFALVPAGVPGGSRRGAIDLSASADALEPHARNLAGGAGEGAPTPEAIGNAIEQLRAAGQALRAPDVDLERAIVELVRVDDTLRAALESLPREPLSPEQKERYDRFLRRAAAEVARRLREAGGSVRPLPEPPPTGAAGKSAIEGNGVGVGKDVSAGAGGKSGSGKVESPDGKRPLDGKRPPAAEDFERVWEDLRRNSRPAAAESDLDPRYRDLVRAFFR